MITVLLQSIKYGIFQHITLLMSKRLFVYPTFLSVYYITLETSVGFVMKMANVWSRMINVRCVVELRL